MATTATKLQFKYGQWSQGVAIDMSKVAGVVVYSGLTKGIYVDGKEFVSGSSTNTELDTLYEQILGANYTRDPKTGNLTSIDLNDLYINKGEDKGHTIVDALNEINDFRNKMHHDEYAQAEIKPIKGATRSEDATKLTIFGIGQGNDLEDDSNDGVIYKAKNDPSDAIEGEGVSTSLVINIAGEYRPTETGEGDNKISRNWIATEHTVNAAVKELRAEIFGTLTPEQLDKTIDSIKEIQEVLKGGDFVEWTHEEVNPETGKTETKVDNVRVLPKVDEDGNPTGEYVLAQVDENGNPVKDENGNYIPTDTVVATVTTDEEGKEVITYADGYDNLQHTQNVQELLDDINNIEEENLVTDIDLDLKNDKGFISKTTESTTDPNGLKTQVVTIGVQYGTFKTGHSDVMDSESDNYTKGIATVEDVQNYIEERFSWVIFETSADDVANKINELGGGKTDRETPVTVDIETPATLNNSLIIK